MTCLKCPPLYKPNKLIVPFGSEVRACCRYSPWRKFSLWHTAEKFSPCVMEFTFEYLASIFFSHVIQHHMIYRQISNYNCITLINIHCFSSLLPFPFLAWDFSWDLLDQSLLSPFLKIPSEWLQSRAAGSRVGGEP